VSSQPETGQWLWQARTNALLLIASLLTLASIVTEAALSISTPFKQHVYSLVLSSSPACAAFNIVLGILIVAEFWLWLAMILYVLRNPDFGPAKKTLLVLLQTLPFVYGSMLIYFFSYRRKFASRPGDPLI
jgi:hypothetical protein